MKLFRFIPLPAVVHWKFNHFVVVERWSPRKIELVDPANGRRSLPAEEFELHFTGVVLTFEPGPHFEKRAAGERPWRHYLAHIVSTPGLFAALGQILLVSLFLQLVGLADQGSD
jgi:ABC-type bacteriocin/lantibiotic exporter with double-glycine peptidase domain